MSWLLEYVGQQPNPVRSENAGVEMVEDPSVPGRMVPLKRANRPFLAHKVYREEQEAQHKDWLERKKERDEKLARGENVEPLGPDPTAIVELGIKDLLKFAFLAILFFLLAGKFFTGDVLWEYRSHWMRLQSWLPSSDRLLTERGLASFDGSEPLKPVYIAIDGDVYDVSTNRATYGSGGSYHHLYNISAGIDAARAFATGCFKTHLTHDIRGLSEQQLKGLEHWKKFFAEHATYVKVGRVLHHPIDPESPIPEPCDSNTQQDGTDPKKSTKENAQLSQHQGDFKQEHKVHEEL